MTFSEQETVPADATKAFGLPPARFDFGRAPMGRRLASLCVSAIGPNIAP